MMLGFKKFFRETLAGQTVSPLFGEPDDLDVPVLTEPRKLGKGPIPLKQALEISKVFRIARETVTGKNIEMFLTVAARPGKRPVEYHQAMGKRWSTSDVTSGLSELKNYGWVFSEKDPSNGQGRLYRLTEKGQKIADRIVEIIGDGK